MGEGPTSVEGPRSEPTRRERRRARTRAALVVSARESLRSSGLAGTTVSDITERADVAHGTFYSYFESKDEILTIIIDEVLDDLLRSVHAVGSAKTIRQRLTAGIGELLHRCQREREIVLALHQVSHRTGEHQERWSEFRDRLRGLVERDLAWLNDHNYTKPMRPALVATVVTRMVEGVALEVLTSPGADVEALLTTTVDLYFDAVFRPAVGTEDIPT